MKNRSLITVTSFIIGGAILIFGIFKIMPLIINKTQMAPDPMILIEEEVIEVMPEQNDATEENDIQSLVTEITTPEQVDRLAQSTCPLVIKFYAPWCGACQYVNGFYKDVAQAVSNVTFYSIDVGNKKVMDRVEALQLTASPIEYLPTFVYRSNNQVIEQVTGAKDKDAFIEFVKTTFKI